jgi:hypothetical protein
MTQKTRNKNPYWNNLSEEEKRAIHDPRDYPIISVIKKLSHEQVRDIAKSVRVKDDFLTHYLKEQKLWIRDAKWYMGINLNRDVSNLELADEILERGLGEKFRLYYAAKYPTNIEYSSNHSLVDFLLNTNVELSN